MIRIKELEKKKYWIWLSCIKGLGSIRKQILLNRYKTPEKIYTLKKEEILQMKGFNEILAENIICRENRENIDKQIEALQKENIKIITIEDKEYPEILKTIYDYPVSIFVKGNEKVVIIGDNGCGKTTLLRKIYEDLKDRNDLKIGYMPQNYIEKMNPDDSPLSFLAFEKTSEQITQARTMLGRMKFTRDEMVQKIQECSEGQKAKLFLIRFIMEKCNVLILDEPTRNLSPLSNPTLRNILNDFLLMHLLLLILLLN